MRSYVNEHRGRFKRVAFFCTCEGSGQTEVLRDLETLAGLPAIATVSMADKEIRNRRHQDRIREFAAEIELGTWNRDALRVAQATSSHAASVNLLDSMK
ncbi:hypothetical protein [Rhodoferax sp.]|uniref:hypothetical protein n=1 Tax=Rhodoferax sp. TaxID=50421 RepID=UPI00276E36C5|nr:hypothetical protein [Rhodoferax sp.]